MGWTSLILMGMATGARFVLPARDHVGARIPRHPRKWSDRTFVEKAALCCYKGSTACLLTGAAVSGLLNKSGYVSAPRGTTAILAAMGVHGVDQWLKDKHIEIFSENRAEGSRCSRIIEIIADVWLSASEYLPFVILTNFQVFSGNDIANWDTFTSYTLLGMALGISASDRTDQKNRKNYRETLIGRAHL